VAACSKDDGYSDTHYKKSGNEATETVSTQMALGTPGYWVPVPEDGVELGLGWDSREGRVVANRCVRMAPVRSTGQTSSLSLDQVSDRSDVMKAMSMSAAGSVKTMFASASGSASFAKSTKVSSQSTTLLLNATVTNGTLFAGPAEAAGPARSAFPAPGVGKAEDTNPAAVGQQNGRLTFQPWAKELMKRPAEFRAYCGDGYVSAINSGARLLATYTFSSQSKAVQKAAAAKVSAKYGPANASGSASSKSSANTENVETHVRYMQVGGGRGAIATTPEALIEKLKKLAEEADDFPRFYDMQVTPYAQMAEWRGGDDWRDADDEYELIADTYWQLTSLEEDVLYILDHYKDYHNRTGLDMQGLKQFLEDTLTVRRAIFNALNHEAVDSAEASKEEQEPLKLFAQSTPKNALVAPREIDVSAIRKGATLGQLAHDLSKALPFKNAALLRINLPVPLADLPKIVKGKYSKEQLQTAVINYYIRDDARQTCERDPTEYACMSPKQLESVAQLVPVRP